MIGDALCKVSALLCPPSDPGLHDRESVCGFLFLSLLKFTTAETGLGVCALWRVLQREVQGPDGGKILLYSLKLRSPSSWGKPGA